MSTSDQFVMTGNLPPPLGHKIKNKNKLADSLRGKQPGLKIWWDNVSKVALLVTVVTANCSRSRWKEECHKENNQLNKQNKVKVLSQVQSVLSASAVQYRGNVLCWKHDNAWHYLLMFKGKDWLLVLCKSVTLCLSKSMMSVCQLMRVLRVLSPRPRYPAQRYLACKLYSEQSLVMSCKCS